jgi:hypothetical protein
MRMTLAILIVAITSAPDLAAAQPVNSEAAAIALAHKTCARQWRVSRNAWKARRVKDHWRVWTGVDGTDGSVSLNVPLNGRVRPAKCEHQVRTP